jgi:hypothetical protein
MDKDALEFAKRKALLARLEELSSQGQEVEEERRLLWQGLMASLGMTQDEMERSLVATLGCQVITARRWITGKYTPRKLAITNLRRVWLGNDPGNAAPAELEGMVDFMGSKIAIHTLSHFFSRLEHAKFCLCAKGWLGYKAGRHPGARDEMVRILTENTELEVHYVFSPKSEAQSTLLRFLQYLRDPNPAIDPHIVERVHAWTTTVSEGENDGLRYNIASPFILVYSDEGAKVLGRSLDIWYELPVAAQYSVDGATTMGGKEDVEYILVELPTYEALSLWQVWRRLFVDILKSNHDRAASSPWENQEWRNHLFGLLSLSNEYSGPGSSLEPLQKVLKG